MNTSNISKASGHWLLAKMGKRVLRPGGKKFTQALIEALHITEGDHLAEFAPGLGQTALLALKQHPASYTGIEADADAIEILRQTIIAPNVCFIQTSAAQTGLPAGSKDKVFGEAMLTMQADHRKSAIIKEAHRILKKGGSYTIHELALLPDMLAEPLKAAIQQDLAKAIKVNARPLTVPEWKMLLQQEGFTVKKVITRPMNLLTPARLIQDEGFLRALKVGCNLLTHPRERYRVMQMRAVFKKYKKHIGAILLICEKQ
ncbi:MAG: methyltransferase domain-containing protein [Niabella sp.]|nr:methyltransferase domain-containing protein [Niabella sp.]